MHLSAAIADSPASQQELDPITTSTVASEKSLGSEVAKPVENKWANLFAGNKTVANGLSLKFVASVLQDGHSVVQLDKQEVELEAEK